MIKHLIFFLFLINFFSVIAQEADSSISLEDLLKEVTEAKSEEEKIKTLLDLAEFQYDRNFSASNEIIEEALKLIGNKADSVSLQQLAKAYIVKGVVYRRKAEYPIAIGYYLKAKSIYEKFNDLEHISDVLHNMGMVYRYQKKHKKAIQHYKQSIKIKGSLKDIHGIAAGYNMMGVSYRQTKRIDSAIICYQKAKKMFRSINSLDDIQRVNNNMVAVNLRQKKYEKALLLVKENIKYAKKYKKKYSLCIAYRNASNTYKKTKEYSKALIYIDSSLQIALKERFRELTAKAYLRKSFLQSKMENYKEAYNQYRIFNRHSDSIFNIENIKKVQELELSYRFNQEKREVELLAKEEASKKWLYFILFILTIVSTLIIGILLFRNYKGKERRLQIKLEKEQIQKELLDQKIKVNEDETKRLIADNTMRMEFKQELLNRLKKEILPVVPEEIKQKVNTLTSEIQMQIKTEGKLSDLQNRIIEVNKGFEAKLIELYPSLTKTEREICTLLRLNLSIKEIMVVRNSSLDAVKSTRYRIRKKLKLASKQELESYIQAI
ncbi:tetratricopeptide repeat protein [Tenacibaculum halocynthiae]|uniref:tetratricopeptide repeat protein n=1 Tax=Tenacibaculum halocynthiae TaxID=1254437 RepID=UPI003894DADB